MVVLSAIFSEDAEGPSASVVRAVATGDVRLAISDDQLSELVRVMGYEDVEGNIGKPLRTFEVALDIGTMGFMPIRAASIGPPHRPEGRLDLRLAYTSGADFIVSYDNAVPEAATN